MPYRSQQQLAADLERQGHLLRIDDEIDPRLEAAEIHRRVYASGGPALLFANVRGCRFPMVSNLFGTIERARFMFRDTLDDVRRLIALKIDPSQFARHPLRYWKAPFHALRMRPRHAASAAVMQCETTLDQLPQLVSWPRDGGPYITLPQVYTEHAAAPGFAKSNLGMYRVQLAGEPFAPNEEVGLHYQIHRGIGVHHAAALRKGVSFRVNIFVGGTPAMTLAAVMPLPEGLSELGFAGALAGHRIPMVTPMENRVRVRRPYGHVFSEKGAFEMFHRPYIYADADFCITGTVLPDKQLPEGPFGDHLGYYSLAHPFPVLKVEHVYHRRNAIWPFTVVGRPPQEDTVFGQLIHELTGPVIPTVVHGVKEVHAVDAAGVHPLLLAIGSERYTPYAPSPRPAELLTQANAILGQGQMSLAKYLMIVAENDAPDLHLHDIPAFFRHLLERIDWRRDLHFQTNTTIDTLDYSGTGFNEGSKVVMAAVGPPIRTLPTEVPADLRLPAGFDDPRVCLPGVLAIRAPRFAVSNFDGVAGAKPQATPQREAAIDRFCGEQPSDERLNAFPLVVLVDDSAFTARALNNFLWVTFTRSNPADDIHGIGAFIDRKHWGCRGPLAIDARIKPHHAPALETDPEVARKIDALAARGGPLAKWL